ncbi:MAG: hypothetical protein KatS3mg089_0646 [Patescibacteria group bacterium]|nr:MAG: hypothetical protein KatS3mg089_0646 [Patescibacteria group bacterium]
MIKNLPSIKFKSQISKVKIVDFQWKLTIKDWILKIFRWQNLGFTLVELLAVIVVIASVSGIVFGVLLASLRGSNKSTNVTILQQNGNYALSQITKMIRNARSLEYPSPCFNETGYIATTSSIIIENPDAGRTTFSCNSLPNGTISSNSASLVDTSSVVVTACSFTCTQNSLYNFPTITISFTLSKKYSSGVVDATTPSSFQSTVIMRNLKE